MNPATASNNNTEGKTAPPPPLATRALATLRACGRLLTALGLALTALAVCRAAGRSGKAGANAGVEGRAFIVTALAYAGCLLALLLGALVLPMWNGDPSPPCQAFAVLLVLWVADFPGDRLAGVIARLVILSHSKAPEHEGS